MCSCVVNQNTCSFVRRRETKEEKAERVAKTMEVSFVPIPLIEVSSFRDDEWRGKNPAFLSLTHTQGQTRAANT